MIEMYRNQWSDSIGGSR